MNSYPQALQRLYSINLHRGVKFGLSNIHRLCELFSHPERSYSTIHVAGTNGKGSVSTKIAKGLRLSGKKTALFTSPHLSTFRERMSIDGILIEEEAIASLLNTVMNKAEEHQIPATFFEIVTLAAFLWFAENKVDIAVLETGLGGRLDATNVVTPLLSIITSISFDHMEILGNTIETITLEKAGIIKPGVPVLIGTHVPLSIIEDIARKQNSPCFQVKDHFQWFDEENSLIARRALELLHVPLNAIELALEARPPCRMEIVKSSPTIILDVAHNPDGLQHLFQAIRAKFPDRALRIICGLSKSKDISRCLKIIGENGTAIHLIENANHRISTKKELADALQQLGYPSYSIEETIEETFENALTLAQENNQIVVVCGSFFIMNDVRKILGLKYPEDPQPLFEVFTSLKN